MILQNRLMDASHLITVGEMASGIAHELNQPLAAIATYAHACDRLLTVANPDIQEVQTALREIAGQAVRAGDIIRRLRGLVRAEGTRRVQADLNDVIGELTGLIQTEARAHGVTYRTDLALQLPNVSVDRDQIQLVVLNLVRNALEALALGQVNASEIVVCTRLAPEGHITLGVCDSGPGVAEKIVDRMFEPFCSTKPAGAGLGLAISRTIVRMHEGTLQYTPNSPTGACFTVRLAVKNGVT